MAIKFRNEQIKAEVVVAREVVKDVVSGDIELRAHGNGSQVSEVLDVKARVRDVKTAITDGGVEINGVINIDCLYNVEEAVEDREKHLMSTYHQEAKIEFENFIDAPEARAGMNVFMNVRVAEITYEVLETDVLEVAVTLIKYCAVSDVRDLKCITQVSGLTREEVVEEQLRIEEWVGDECVRMTVAKEIELAEGSPEVEDILQIKGEIAKTDSRAVEKGVESTGIIEVNILYRTHDDDHDLRQFDERIEFDHKVDLFAVYDGMTVYSNHKLTDLSVQRVSDDKLRVVAQLEVYVKVTKPRLLNVVTDILNDMIDTERVAVVMEEVIGRNRVKDPVTRRINVPATRPDIARLHFGYARVKDLTSMVNNGGVVVEGSLEGTAYYAAREDYFDGEMTVCLKDYFDFDTFVPVEGCEEGMTVYVESEVKRASCQVLNDRTLEMNVVLERAVKVSNRVELECVTELVEISPMVLSAEKPSVIVYVVQRGDSLWKIARRYKVDMDALIEYNDLEEPDNLEIGQKIAIPKGLIGARG